MHFFGRRNKNLLDVELIGLKFANPVGIYLPADTPLKSNRRYWKAAFYTLEPPKDDVLNWITNLQKIKQNTLLAVNLNQDFIRSFSLVYDFADLIIIDPDNKNGISSPDIADTAQLLDELMNLRLCYEYYRPVFLRLSQGDSPEDIHPLVSCARLAGLDGFVVPSAAKLRLVQEECQSRIPLIAESDTPEDALACWQAGAQLIETRMRPRAIYKLLKTLEKNSSQPL